MKILVFEYITGGGLISESPPPSLQYEGSLMAAALINDLSALPNIELICLEDQRFPFKGFNQEPHRQLRTITIRSQEHFQATWLEQIQQCDAVWPIAPESGGILEALCRDVQCEGKLLLNCPDHAVKLTASKILTSSRLSAKGIKVIPTYRLAGYPQYLQGPWVIKPNDGEGCQGIIQIDHPEELNCKRIEPEFADYIIQPLLAGEALSLSGLFCDGDARLLSCNRQLLVQDKERFRLTGCDVNIEPRKRERFQGLTALIARALPELRGYAGIDLIRTEQDELIVVEINPRLTTSYAGLRDALQLNPAAMVLGIFTTGRLPDINADLTGETVHLSLAEIDA